MHTVFTNICSSFQGDVSQLSPLMKAAVQPSSMPYTTQTPKETTAMAPLTSFHPNSGVGASPGNASGGVYPSSSVPGVSPTYPLPRPSSVPQTTYRTPGSSMQPYPPQYSLPPGMSPPWRDAYPQPQIGAVRGASPSGPFAPKTAAELGLLDRPETSYEGMELSNIVDRMTSAFPLDDHSGNSYIVQITICSAVFCSLQEESVLLNNANAHCPPPRSRGYSVSVLNDTSCHKIL